MREEDRTISRSLNPGNAPLFIHDEARMNVDGLHRKYLAEETLRWDVSGQKAPAA